MNIHLKFGKNWPVTTEILLTLSLCGVGGWVGGGGGGLQSFSSQTQHRLG